MQEPTAIQFKANIHIIGINPFVFVPPKILKQILKQAGKDKGPIPIKGHINGKAYKQTLVRYSNEWRLYINTAMLKNSPKRVGEKIEISIEFDNDSREIEMPAAFAKALKANKEAAITFDKLIPSRKKEIIRYLANLKTAATLEKNIAKAIGFLIGKEKFAGRENSKPAAEKAKPPQALHVVQQKQGRVKPTAIKQPVAPVDDNDALEKEADVMGALAYNASKKKADKKE